jgi:hypothetical protein
MRRIVAGGTAAALLAAAAIEIATAGTPADGEPPAVDCGSRIQLTGGPAPRPSRRDLRLGALYVSGLREFGRTEPPSRFEPEPGERYAFVKSAPVVDAGAAVIYSVARADRSAMDIEVARSSTPHARGDVVRLDPCKPDHEVAGKPVGPRTPFVGGVMVTGPGCYSLRARSKGEPAITRRVKLGVERCARASPARGGRRARR